MTAQHRAASAPVARLLTSYACVAVAIGMPWPLLMVLVWEQYGAGTHGALILGLTGAARMAPFVVLSWAVGSLGDRMRRDRLVRTATALRVVGLLTATLALSADRVGVAVLAAGLAVAVGTPTYPTIAAALPRLAGDRAPRVTETLVTIEVSAWVVGPALGGLMLVPALRDWTVAAATALALLAWILVVPVRLTGPTERGGGTAPAMLRQVAARPRTWGALAIAGSLNLALAAIGMALLPLSHLDWNDGDAAFGIATACLGFGALGAPLLARAMRPSAPRWLVALGLATLVVAATPVPWLAYVPLAVAGASGVVVESALTQTIQREMPDAFRAGALGLADSVMVGAFLVGTLATPWVADLIGARSALLVAASVALAPVAIGVLAVRGTRPTTRVPQAVGG